MIKTSNIIIVGQNLTLLEPCSVFISFLSGVIGIGHFTWKNMRTAEKVSCCDKFKWGFAVVLLWGAVIMVAMFTNLNPILWNYDLPNWAKDNWSLIRSG